MNPNDPANVKEWGANPWLGPLNKQFVLLLNLHHLVEQDTTRRVTVPALLSCPPGKKTSHQTRMAIIFRCM